MNSVVKYTTKKAIQEALTFMCSKFNLLNFVQLSDTLLIITEPSKPAPVSLFSSSRSLRLLSIEELLGSYE
jgi:hypothetical protein